MITESNLNHQHLITVCTVLRNDQDIVENFVHELAKLLAKHYEFYEVLLVDNHSSDETPHMVQHLQEKVPNLRLIRLSQVYSTETALTAALDNSIGDFVVVLEPRYDDLTLIVDLMQQAIIGSDIVVVRQPSQQRYYLLDQWMGKVVFHLAGLIIGQPIHVQDSRFRAYSRRAVNALAQVRRKRRYLKYANSMIGYSQSYIDAPTNPNTPRKTVQRLETISLVVDIIVASSATPLRLTSLIGLFASFLSLIYILYIIVVTLVRDDIVEGWLTTNVVMSVMFFLLFLVLTVLTEYIARILDETRDEPLYFIESESASKVAPYTRLKEQDDSINVVEN